jgi:hypothetical protein
MRGRFVSEDPMGLEGGVNLYEYAESGPLNGVDPLGLFTVVVAENGARTGATWGATLTLYADNGNVLAVVRGSSWPDVGEANPGIAPGVYFARYGKEAHNDKPGLLLYPRNAIPTIGPNPIHGNDKWWATGINLHCGGVTSRGSQGCITIENRAKQCQRFFEQLDKLKRRETGQVILMREFD